MESELVRRALGVEIKDRDRAGAWEMREERANVRGARWPMADVLRRAAAPADMIDFFFSVVNCVGGRENKRLNVVGQLDKSMDRYRAEIGE